jgi:hypothetical protein
MYQVQMRWRAENMVWSRWYGMRLYTNKDEAHGAMLELAINGSPINEWRVIESDPETEHECVFIR